MCENTTICQQCEYRQPRDATVDDVVVAKGAWVCMMCCVPGASKEILARRRPWERACDILDRTESTGDYDIQKTIAGR